MKKLYFLLALCVLSVTGCVQTKIAKQETYFGVESKKDFPKIKGVQLELAITGSPELISGRDKSVTFILKNLSNNPLSIPEWYSHEPDNIEISCQIWFPNQTAPDEDRWITYPVVLKHPVRHYPLRLGGKMFVTIDVPLGFLEHLIVAPGTERRYFLKAKLNLKSVSAESKVTAITVKPPVKTPGKNRLGR